MSRRRKWPHNADLPVELRLTGQQYERLYGAYLDSRQLCADFAHWLVLAAHFYAWYQEQERQWVDAALLPGRRARDE